MTTATEWMPKKKSRHDKRDPRLIWKTLRATHGQFKAEAIWKRISGQWELVQASPAIDLIIATMKPEEAEAAMKKRRWKCSWI